MIGDLLRSPEALDDVVMIHELMCLVSRVNCLALVAHANNLQAPPSAYKYVVCLWMCSALAISLLVIPISISLLICCDSSVLFAFSKLTCLKRKGLKLTSVLFCEKRLQPRLLFWEKRLKPTSFSIESFICSQ